MIHSDSPDLVILGAGAAGLAAAIFAGEAAMGSTHRILLLEGAKKPGTKILISGGTRCNVTNEKVAPEDYWGGPRPTIRKVLRAFDGGRTVEWMKSLGVEVKLEPTGKYFPKTDEARTVLEALLARVRALGVELRAASRVTDIEKTARGFELTVAGQTEKITASRLIVATGGLSIPKSGSDGWGLDVMRRLGHTIVPTTPALTPILLKKGSDIGGRFDEFSGITLEARLTLSTKEGRQIEVITGSLLFTHFGISGPAALDMSRHLLRARLDHPEKPLRLYFGVPHLQTPEAADSWLLEQTEQNPRRTAASAIAPLLPERLAKAIAEEFGPLAHLTREQRWTIAQRLTRLPLEVIGDRGYAFAEVTAGGVDLREIDSKTMQSRKHPGIFICGEMLDVDGRIGGFNFQWAWASGYLAGRGAIASLANAQPH